MRLNHGTWVIVADGEKALFLVNEGTRAEISLRLAQLEEIDNPPNREQSTDRPGRYPDAGIGKSAFAETDWKRLEKDRFAEDLAEELYKAAQGGRYQDLVIVAAPRTLGTIRQKLHKETLDRLGGEIAKDLTNHDLGKIEQILTTA